MSLIKKHTSVKERAAKSRSKNAIEPEITIVYKSKTSSSSFPQKIDKANKLLSKAKLMK